jgi:hypothetical protein
MFYYYNQVDQVDETEVSEREVFEMEGLDKEGEKRLFFV